MKFFVVGLISILVIIYLEYKLKTWRKETLFLSFKKNLNVINVVCVSLLFASLMLLISLLLEKCGVFINGKETFEIEMLPYILYSVSIVPLIEEYFYRFLPYKIVLLPQYFKYLLVLSSLVFAFSHSVVGAEYVYIFCMACILSYIYLKTKNILYSIFSHGVYNLFVFLNYYAYFNNVLILVIIIFICLIILYRDKIKILKF